MAAVYLLVVWSLAPCALTLEEGRSVRHALGRSRALVRGAFWRTFGALVLLSLLVAVLQGSGSVLVQVIGSLLQAVGAPDAASQPVWVTITVSLLSNLLGILVRPALLRRSYAAVLRSAHPGEGYDLAVQARALAPPAAKPDDRPPPRPRGAGTRRPVWCAAAFAGVLLLFGPAAAQAMSVAEYRTLVVGAAASLAQLPEDDASGRAAALAAVERTVGTVEAVELPNGDTLRPTNPPLRAALAAGEMRRRRREWRRLPMRCNGPRPAAPPRQETPSASWPTFSRGPSFGRRRRTPHPGCSPPPQQAERLWRRILYWLASQGDSQVHPLWIGVAVLIVAAVVAVLVGAFGGNVVAGARVATLAPATEPRASTSRARAEALAASGDYRAAVHELSGDAVAPGRAPVFALPPQPRPTASTCCAERSAPALAQPLGALVEGYDRFWYSGTACTAAEWQRFRR